MRSPCKIVEVTGASRGLGLALGKAFAVERNRFFKPSAKAMLLPIAANEMLN